MAAGLLYNEVPNGTSSTTLGSCAFLMGGTTVAVTLTVAMET